MQVGTPSLLLAISYLYAATVATSTNAVDVDPEAPDELVKSQFSPDPFAGQNAFDLALSGDFALVQIHVPPDALLRGDRLPYAGVRADFCAIAFNERQKSNPSLFPQYRDVVADSTHCSEHGVSLDLGDVVTAARERDDALDTNTRSMYTPKAILFHQPKSGSTVLTNAIAVSDPKKVRVVSGSAVLLDALKVCGGQVGVVCDASMHQAQVRLVKDVAYMLGRTTDPEETDLYFKLPPAGAFYMGVAREAFPDSKWIFTYRDPDTVMLKVMGTVFKKSCSAHYRKHAAVREYVQRTGEHYSMTDEELCSAAMATMVSLAFEEHYTSGTGLLVNYDTDIFGGEGVETILNNYLGIDLDDDATRARVQEQLGKKATGGTGQPWTVEDERRVLNEPRDVNTLVQASEGFLEREMRKQRELHEER